MAQEYLARLDDTLELQPGWLGRAVEVLEADPGIGCLSLVPPHDYQRGRGRPRTVHVVPVTLEHIDMRCFVTRRALVARHEGKRWPTCPTTHAPSRPSWRARARGSLTCRAS